MNIASAGGSSTSNWFINATAEGNTGGEGMANLSLSLQSVSEDDWVKIKASIKWLLAQSVLGWA